MGNVKVLGEALGQGLALALVPNTALGMALEAALLTPTMFLTAAPALAPAPAPPLFVGNCWGRKVPS